MAEQPDPDPQPESAADAKAKDRAAAFARWADSERLGGTPISPPIPETDTSQ